MRLVSLSSQELVGGWPEMSSNSMRNRSPDRGWAALLPVGTFKVQIIGYYSG
jgi:hypothetical protein